MRQLKFFTIFIFSNLLLITACSPLSVTSSKEQNLKRYEIAVPQDLQKNINPQGPSLLLYPVQTNGRFNTPRIAYSLNTYEIAYYAQSEWADSPGQLLLPLLVAAMENSGQFSAVVVSGSSAITDLALDTELLNLIQLHDGNNSKIQLILRAQLIDLRKRQVLASDTFSLEEVAPSNDPYGAVIATNKAANRLTQVLQDFVTRSLH